MRRLVLFLLLALLALPGAAGERRYAVLSLIGDEMMLVGQEQKTGGRLDRNPRQYIELTDPFADKAALLAVNEALKKIDPASEPVLLLGRDRRLYATQMQLLDSGGDMMKLLGDIRPLLGNSKATHLILITKARHEARIQLRNEWVGHGQLHGIGYYIDPNIDLQVSETGQSATGFAAAFAYFTIALVDLERAQVLAERRVTASRTYTTPNSVNAIDLWNGMPAAQRVRLLRDLVGDEAGAAVPKLLSESR